MANEQLLKDLRALGKTGGYFGEIVLSGTPGVQVYKKSIIERDSVLFLMARSGRAKSLHLVSEHSRPGFWDTFRGEKMAEGLLKCPLSHHNALAIQNVFELFKAVS